MWYSCYVTVTDFTDDGMMVKFLILINLIVYFINVTRSDFK